MSAPLNRAPSIRDALDAPDGVQAVRVVMRRGGRFTCWEILGTRADIEAEHAIPQSIEWPDGAQRMHWEAGRLLYQLHRIRPKGLKGPQGLWISGDWWSLYCTLRHSLDREALHIRRMKAELAAELYRHSPEGRRDLAVSVEKLMRAADDKKFQSFKALVPGLSCSMRGGKPHAMKSTGDAA